VIRWIFFDIGNVIMNDDPVMAFLYAELYAAIREKGVGLSFEQLLLEREAAIRESGPGHWYLLGDRYLGTDGLHALMHHCASRIRADYMAFHNVLPGMFDLLESLSREFNLGLLANQLRESVDALELCGLRRFFRVLAVSEVLGLKKPDPAIFEWALARAGCTAEESIMVGDRLDNDIRPARALGFHTIWFHAPLLEKGYDPPPGTARAYFESQQRISIAQILPHGPEEQPDGEATSCATLLAEIHRLKDSLPGTVPSIRAGL
jgi:5'-nucleotidase